MQGAEPPGDTYTNQIHSGSSEFPRVQAAVESAAAETALPVVAGGAPRGLREGEEGTVTREGRLIPQCAPAAPRVEKTTAPGPSLQRLTFMGSAR